jgi:hypothetical protein
MDRGSDYEDLARALEAMNNVSLHQTDRIFPPTQVGEFSFPTRLHPLTCGNNSDHAPLYPYWNGDRVQLICRDCDYTQNNAGPHSLER